VRLLAKSRLEVRNKSIRENRAERVAGKSARMEELGERYHLPVGLTATSRSFSLGPEGPTGVPIRNEGHVPRFVAIINDPVRFKRVGDYYDAVIADLNNRCRERKTRLVLINLHLIRMGHGQEYHDAQESVRHLLLTIASRHGIELVDTKGRLSYKSGCFLTGDGHLSEKGHRELAELLHSEVLSSASTSATDQ
jgi:hypothetical protein